MGRLKIIPLPNCAWFVMGSVHLWKGLSFLQTEIVDKKEEGKKKRCRSFVLPRNHHRTSTALRAVNIKRKKREQNPIPNPSNTLSCKDTYISYILFFPVSSTSCVVWYRNWSFIMTKWLDLSWQKSKSKKTIYTLWKNSSAAGLQNARCFSSETWWGLLCSCLVCRS